MEQWREKLKSSIRTIDDLKRRAKLDGGEEKRLSEAIHTFPMQITPYYFNLINWEDPDDPLKKIVIPSVEELSAEGSLDTSKENEITILPGIQHKYVSTVLLLASDVCASHCRFCFRRRLRMDGSSTEVLKSPEQLEKALAYIKNHREVDNVLITGGDPLMLTNRRLDSILEGLRKIEHVKIIRIGTRTPAYLPQRITEDVEFRNIISKHNREDSRIYFIVHFDHPRELTKEAIRALKLLIEEGAILRNQTVLLKGVNDKPEIIRELFNKLSYVGVTPYYLFQDRPVKGGKYFQVPLKESYRIFEQAKKGMTGLAKTASYIISHSTGKIAIVGIDDDRIYLKYHQAKNPEDTGKFFSLKLEEDTYWFDDLVA